MSLALLVAYIDDAIGRFEGLRSRVHSLTAACLQQGDALTRLPLICHSMATALQIRTCQLCQSCIDLLVKVIIESSPNWAKTPLAL